MDDVTQILSRIENGDASAAEHLLPLIYHELRRLAAQKMAKESPGQTLQPTALVHEAYVRLVGGLVKTEWQSRGHFFAAAAEAMRRILVENARRKRGPRHGGQWARCELQESDATIELTNADDLLDLDTALMELAEKDADAARLVELRYFAGLSNEEAAKALGISERTAKRNWSYARAWLRRRLDSR
jgi:RNA polymerase sigma factor (TIGR02999 family)